MGKFNNKIEAEFTPPKKWKLSRQLTYKNKDIDCEPLNAVKVATPAHRITVKKGFVTDLASTPKILWNILAPWDVARAAIIKNSEKPEVVKNAKKAADDVFLMGMKDADPSIPKWKIYAAYYAVRIFGRWSIIPTEDNT